MKIVWIICLTIKDIQPDECGEYTAIVQDDFCEAKSSCTVTVNGELCFYFSVSVQLIMMIKFKLVTLVTQTSGVI